MSFLGLEDYNDRWNGENKTVFRNSDELVYTVNPDDPMGIIQDDEWYDDAVVQTDVWDHNIQSLLDAGIPLSFGSDDYTTEMMFYDVADDRIEGKLAAPAVVITDYEWVEPYPKTASFDDIPDDEEEMIRQMQDHLTYLIDEGEIAVQERELTENDFVGPGCLRQFGRNPEGDVYLLEFGEHHNMIEGPYNGHEFLEEHGIERKNHGIRSPIMLGDMSSYIWE